MVLKDVLLATSVASLVCCAITGFARADEVVLKDGTKILGRVSNDEKAYLVVQTDEGEQVVNHEVVDHVTRDASTEDTTPSNVTDVLGGRAGKHWGFGAGGALVPGSAGNTHVLIAAVHLNVGLDVGELRFSGYPFEGSSPSSSFVGTLLAAEYRLGIGPVFAFGLGPFVGYASFSRKHPDDTKTFDGPSAALGVITTPIVLRFGGIEASASVFLLKPTAVKDGNPGGFFMLSYLFL